MSKQTHHWKCGICGETGYGYGTAELAATALRVHKALRHPHGK